MLFAFEFLCSVPFSHGREQFVRIYTGLVAKAFLTSKSGSLIKAFLMLFLCFDVVCGLNFLMIRYDHGRLGDSLWRRLGIWLRCAGFAALCNCFLSDHGLLISPRFFLIFLLFVLLTRVVSIGP